MPEILNETPPKLVSLLQINADGKVYLVAIDPSVATVEIGDRLDFRHRAGPMIHGYVEDILTVDDRGPVYSFIARFQTVYTPMTVYSVTWTHPDVMETLY
jgi:hypothetical protein